MDEYIGGSIFAVILIALIFWGAMAWIKEGCFPYGSDNVTDIAKKFFKSIKETIQIAKDLHDNSIEAEKELFKANKAEKVSDLATQALTITEKYYAIKDKNCVLNGTYNNSAYLYDEAYEGVSLLADAYTTRVDLDNSISVLEEQIKKVENLISIESKSFGKHVVDHIEETNKTMKKENLSKVFKFKNYLKFFVVMFLPLILGTIWFLSIGKGDLFNFIFEEMTFISNGNNMETIIKSVLLIVTAFIIFFVVLPSLIFWLAACSIAGYGEASMSSVLNDKALMSFGEELREYLMLIEGRDRDEIIRMQISDLWQQDLNLGSKIKEKINEEWFTVINNVIKNGKACSKLLPYSVSEWATLKEEMKHGNSKTIIAAQTSIKEAYKRKKEQEEYERAKAKAELELEIAQEERKRNFENAVISLGKMSEKVSDAVKAEKEYYKSAQKELERQTEELRDLKKKIDS